MNDFLSLVIYTPIGVGIGYLFLRWKDRHKDKSAIEMNSVEQAKVVQGMALQMLEPLNSRIERLKGVINDLQSEVVLLTSELKTERAARIVAEEERDYYKALAGKN